MCRKKKEPTVTAEEQAEFDAFIESFGENLVSPSAFKQTSPPSCEKRAIAQKRRGLFSEEAVKARRDAESEERELLPIGQTKLIAIKNALTDLSSVDHSELSSLEAQRYVVQRCKDCLSLLKRKPVPTLPPARVVERRSSAGCSTSGEEEVDPPKTPPRRGGKPYGAVGKAAWMHHNIKEPFDGESEEDDEEGEEGDEIPLCSPTTPEELRRCPGRVARNGGEATV
tara:strand:+ start:1619 stop:2296 length:678 start_codon:yes stop_codon:yes gene_type:complete